MGSSGWSLPLTKLKGARATNRALQSAILKTLTAVWERVVPSEYHALARGWISVGDDSLLTVQEGDSRQSPDALTFMFYESVDWARGLAEHWLRHAFAWGRPDFEAVLERLGFAIEPARWPGVLEVMADVDRYFVDGERIGTIEQNEVRWVVANGRDSSPTTTPLAQLPKELRDRVTGHDHCECPVCAAFSDDVRRPLHTTGPAHRIDPVWASTSIGPVLALRDGSVIIVNTDADRSAWTVRGNASNDGWPTVSQLSEPKRKVDMLHAVGATQVAIMGYTSPKPPRVASTSENNGKTWSAPAPTRLPELKEPKFVAHPHHPQTVHAMPRWTPAKQIFRSDDGGRTFGKPFAPTIRGKAQIVEDVVALGKRLILACKRNRNAPRFLAVADNAEELAALDLGDFVPQALSCSSKGVVAAFGLIGEVPMLLRSYDEGRTWRPSGAPGNVYCVHLGERWFAIENAWGAPDVGLHVSDDEGSRWQRVVDGSLIGLVPDATDRNSIYAISGNTLVRICIGEVTASALPAAPWQQPASKPPTNLSPRRL